MKQTKIVFLLGIAGSGKDTVGKTLSDKGFTRVSFADAVKQEYAKLINIDINELYIQGPKKESHREGIIAFAEGEKLKDPLVWLKKAFEPYIEDGEFKEGLKLVVTDFRRDCEVDWYFNVWSDIKEFEEREGVLSTKKYPINLRMFYINRPEVIDEDVLTHYAIGKVQGINKAQPGFIDATIHLKGQKYMSDVEYVEFKSDIQKKIEKLIYLFDL